MRDDFTLGDVFGDALAHLGQKLDMHFAFGVLASIVTALVLGAVWFCLFFTELLLSHEGHVFDDGVWLYDAIHALAAIVTGVYAWVLLSLHAAFTLAAGSAARVDERPEFSSSLDRAYARLRAHLAFTFPRMTLDATLIVITVVSLDACGVSTWPRDDASIAASAYDSWLDGATSVVLASLVVASAMSIVRSATGLTAVVIQMESLGPLASVRRSSALLVGRRLHFIGLRLIWLTMASVVVVGVSTPMLVLPWLAIATGPGGSFFDLLTLPCAMVFAFVLTTLHAFDTALLRAYYARLVPRETASEVCESPTPDEDAPMLASR